MHRTLCAELYCERSEQPLAKVRFEPGQTNTNRIHEKCYSISKYLNCRIFLASPGLFLQELEVLNVIGTPQKNGNFLSLSKILRDIKLTSLHDPERIYRPDSDGFGVVCAFVGCSCPRRVIRSSTGLTFVALSLVKALYAIMIVEVLF